MKKLNLCVLRGIIIMLFGTSVTMNHTWQFFGYACLGMGVMFGISYIDYRKIFGRPLYACIMAFAGLLLLRKCGLSGGFGVIVISLTMVIVCLWIKPKESCKIQKFRMIFAGVFTGINLTAAGSMVFRNGESIEAFVSGDGKAVYIYDIIAYFLRGSRMWGRSVDTVEIVKWLPKYKDSCIVTTYIASYGWFFGALAVIAVAGMVGKIIFDLQKMSLAGKMVGTGCVVILAMELAIVVFQNLLIIPFTVFQAFLPFFSMGKGSVFISYALVGVVMSVYRYEPERL